MQKLALISMHYCPIVAPQVRTAATHSIFSLVSKVYSAGQQSSLYMSGEFEEETSEFREVAFLY
jgi:hypothetical protein